MVIHMRDYTPCRRGLPVGVYPIPSHSGTHTSQDGLKRVHFRTLFGPFLRIAEVV